ncbi:MAG: indole-3-glycerol phosphate synthase TrpC [Planctomycetota bacterium]
MTVLEEILVKTRQTIAEDRLQRDEQSLRDEIKGMPPCRGFYDALAETDSVRLIAEVKRRSPSAGLIREDFDPVKIARTYAESGAACISVLTDQPFFGGQLSYLREIRAAVDLPLLRKDFFVDSYQLLQARAAGADCVLLIAECLSAEALKTLHDESLALGMGVLIELYDPKNLPAVLATGCRLVGVNNRDLHTFQTDLQHTVRMRNKIPSDRLLVGESGIRSAEDVATLKQSGVKAILVGESLMRQDDIALAVKNLLRGA